MRKLQVRIVNLRGLHARAASRLVQTASRFRSKIELIKDEIHSDAKSILGVLLLAAAKGTELTILIDGDDEDEALVAIQELFDRGFYETNENEDKTPVESSS